VPRCDPGIAFFDKGDGPFFEGHVTFYRVGSRRSIKIHVRSEESDGRVIIRDQVLQQEKIHVTFEVAEQPKELAIPRNVVVQGTFLPKVISSDAFKCQVESIPDPLVAASSTIDRHPAVELISREYHHPADGVNNVTKKFHLFIWYLTDDVRIPFVFEISWQYGIARQDKFSELGIMIKVSFSRTAIEIENNAAWKRLAP
jgi:hypothetical protein